MDWLDFPKIKLTKDQVLSRLQFIESNFAIGLCSFAVLNRDICLKELARMDIGLGSVKFFLKDWAVALEDEEKRRLILTQFILQIKRILISETFDLVEYYSRKTRNEPLFKKQPWYNFARIIRNTANHNLIFDFSYESKSIFPVIWQGCTIAQEMEGLEMRPEFIPPPSAWYLYQEMKEFISKQL
jgi:hypothetical protein